LDEVKQRFSIVFLSLLLLIVAAACNQSREDIVEDLTKKLDRLDGYTANAVMTFKHGEKQQKYLAEIWYKKPDFYRVVLKDEDGKNPQMIIKNKDGVYLITPALNRKYHFESDWPNNRSQYYLYQSLAKDIIHDGNAKFEARNDDYVFTTKTNYPTKLLAYQKITLKKKKLAPENVKIMDEDMNVVIDITFKNFKFGPKFDSDAFDVDKNELSMKFDAHLPTMAAQHSSFKIYKPTISLTDTKLAYSKDVTEDSERKFILKYEGKKPFTLVETQSQVTAKSASVSMEADPVDLGFTVGIITDHSLSWSYDGMDFYLASDKLSAEEMRDVARSVVGMINK
jgi:outer membrane lipoprotein-sorting protein